MRTPMMLFVILGIPFSFSACTYYMPMTVSSTSIGNQSEVPVKVVSGRSEASYFLIFGPFGDDSLQAALEDARRQGDGDTLANVFVDRKLFCVPTCGWSLYTAVETRVTGTLVKYQDERSRQFVKAPEKVVLIPNSTKLDIAAEAAYNQLLMSFGEDQLAAEAVFESFSGQTRNDLKQFVLTKRGNGSAWNWKLAVPADASGNEKRFLYWYVKNYTEYKPVE